MKPINVLQPQPSRILANLTRPAPAAHNEDYQVSIKLFPVSESHISQMTSDIERTETVC